MGIVLLMGMFVISTAVVMYGMFGSRWMSVVTGATASRIRHVHVESERGPAPKVSPLTAKPRPGASTVGLETSDLADEDKVKAKMSPKGQSGPVEPDPAPAKPESEGASLAMDEHGKPTDPASVAAAAKADSAKADNGKTENGKADNGKNGASKNGRSTKSKAAKGEDRNA